MERSEHPPSPRLRGIVLRSFSEGGHKLFGRTYPHTNCVFSICYIAIGVGVKFADALL